MNTKLAANYGTILGLLAFAYFVMLAMMGLNPLGTYKLVASLLPIYFLYIAIKKQRNEFLGGFISYKQSLMFGIATSFFFATIFAALVFMYGKFIDVNLVEVVKEDMMLQLSEASRMMGESKMIDKAIDELDKTTISSLAWGEYVNKVIWCFIVSLVLAGILKKEKPMFDDTFKSV